MYDNDVSPDTEAQKKRNYGGKNNQIEWSGVMFTNLNRKIFVTTFLLKIQRK